MAYSKVALWCICNLTVPVQNFRFGFPFGFRTVFVASPQYTTKHDTTKHDKTGAPLMNGLANVTQIPRSGCPICLDGLDQKHEFTGHSITTTRPCGHQFHTGCITTWLNANLGCPIERRIVTTLDVQPPRTISLPLPPCWRTILTNSAKQGDLASVQVLLNRGAHADAGQYSIRTPFFFAAKNGHVAVALHLAEHGANAPIAQFWLAHCYLVGNGIEQNEPEAIKWFQKAADQDCIPAIEALGLIHKRNPGTEGNLAKALSYFKLAAQRESLVGQFNLASMLMHGEGTERNPTLAVHWYRQAANHGYGEAQQCLARCLRSGTGTQQDLPAALKWFRAAAEQGSAEAQWEVGEILFTDMGSHSDQMQALNCWITSARQGFSTAQYFVGTMLLSSAHVPTRIREAIVWLERAANQGNLPALRRLAQIYSDGKLVSKDLSQAKKWLLILAEQGNPIGQKDLANLYLNSDTHQGFTDALPWFRKAAAQDNAEAQCALGWMHLKGKGVRPKHTKALDWFAKAAVQGHISAIKWLISMHLSSDKKTSVSEALQCFLSATAGVNDTSTQDKMVCAYQQGPPMQRIPASIVNFLRRTRGQPRNSALLAKLYTNEKWLADQLHKVIKTPGINSKDMLRVLPEILSPFTEQRERHDALALHTLAWMCFEKPGTLGNISRALNFLQQAAALGSVSAQGSLSLIHRSGEITKKNVSLCINWLRWASKQSNAVAQRELARLHLKGKDTERNPGSALPLLHSAAQQGDAIAQGLLGRMYLHGNGTKKDSQTALNWLNKAAMQEDTQGLFTLARTLQKGRDAGQNQAKARKYFRRAALLGHTPSQVSLGAMYWQGTPKNLALALAWLRRAHANGNRKARPLLARIIEVISSSCIRQTRRYTTGNRLPRYGNILKQRRCHFLPSASPWESRRCPALIKRQFSCK